MVLGSPTLPGSARRKEYLAQVDLRMTWNYWEVWREETLVLAIVLQRCVIHAGASQNVFCRAVQEFHDCLVPMGEEGNLFIMEMEIWEGVRKDPMATTPSKGSLHQQLEWRSLPVLLHLSLYLHQMGRGCVSWGPGPGAKKVATTTLRFSPLGSDNPAIPPLEDMYRHGTKAMGTLLDLTALVSLQVTISHTPVTGEVHYHLQAQSITRRSLSGTSCQEHLELSPKIEELWVIITVPWILETLFPIIDLSKYPVPK